MAKKGKRQYFYMNKNGNVIYTDDQTKVIGNHVVWDQRQMNDGVIEHTLKTPGGKEIAVIRSGSWSHNDRYNTFLRVKEKATKTIR
jgi:hypothetical protein